MTSRLDGFSSEALRDSDRETAELHPGLQPYLGDGTEIAAALDFVADAIRADVDFEPAESDVDVRGLFNAAVKLFQYVEALEARTGSLKLPDSK